jgi:hypothetical protein
MNNKDEIETETSEMVEAVFFCYYDGTNADGTIDETHFTWDCAKLASEWDGKTDVTEDGRFFDLTIDVDSRLFAEVGTPAHDEWMDSVGGIVENMWDALNLAWVDSKTNEVSA